MSRRRQIQSENAVNLFPFLAVLICTMGTLIVLLVVVVQQARDTAALDTPAPTVPTGTPPQIIPPPAVDPGVNETTRKQLEDVRWANELLAKSREQTLLDLEERRGDLSRIEDQVRTLNDQLNGLEKQAQALLDAEAQRFVPNQQAEVELENVRAQIVEAQRTLTEKQAQAAKARKQYAIVPYEGPNGTLRRPVYIECLANGVVIQPEGIRFEARDFAVSGAASPLAAALRAYREYLSDAGLIGAHGEPYPLLIVRPHGERAYTASRNALRSWDDAFGYEMVPAEMELKYPESDPALVVAVQNAVADARDALPANIPGRRGGDVVADASEGSGTDGLGSGGSRPGNASEAPTFSLGRGPGGGLVANTPGGRMPASRLAGGMRSGSSSRRASDGRHQRPAPPRGASPAGTIARPAPGNPGFDATRNPHAGAPMQEGSLRTAHGAVVAADSVPGDGSGADTGSPGGAVAQATSAEPVQSGQASQFSASLQSQSLAKTQGDNWALPNAAEGAIAISRPVAATLDTAHFVLETERGQKHVPIENGSVDLAIEPIVAEIWKVIKGWGIAGTGVYWKPTVHVKVQPGAEAMFEEISALMKNSGLDIKRR